MSPITKVEGLIPGAQRRPFAVRLFRLPGWKLLLLTEACFWLAVARLALRGVPFPRIGRYLGGMKPPAPSVDIPSNSDPKSNPLRLARRVGWAVNMAGDTLPAEFVCLPRALAAWQMLHRRGIEPRLHFGVLRADAPREQQAVAQAQVVPGLQTHAWLSYGDVQITGYPVAHDCVELGFFARTGRAADSPEKNLVNSGRRR